MQNHQFVFNMNKLKLKTTNLVCLFVCFAFNLLFLISIETECRWNNKSSGWASHSWRSANSLDSHEERKRFVNKDHLMTTISMTTMETTKQEPFPVLSKPLSSLSLLARELRNREERKSLSV